MYCIPAPDTRDVKSCMQGASLLCRGRSASCSGCLNGVPRRATALSISRADQGAVNERANQRRRAGWELRIPPDTTLDIASRIAGGPAASGHETVPHRHASEAAEVAVPRRSKLWSAPTPLTAYLYRVATSHATLSKKAARLRNKGAIALPRSATAQVANCRQGVTTTEQMQR